MRFLIQLQIPSENQNSQYIPINYQYELSSWIYKTINKGDPIFAEWLHSNGYSSGSKSFKMFVFSNLKIPEYKIENSYINILSNEISFVISFMLNETAEPFIHGMFKEGELSLGDISKQTLFTVKSIERLPDPDFEKNIFCRTISPMVVSGKLSTENKHTTFFNPKDTQFEDIFISNLIHKFIALSQHSNKIVDISAESDIKLRCAGKFKEKLITIKANTPSQTRVKGYLFDFELQAPLILKKIAYHAGCGEKNSLGFGCIDIIK